MVEVLTYSFGDLRPLKGVSEMEADAVVGVGFDFDYYYRYYY